MTATTKVTLSLDDDALGHARTSAAREGVSLSAWLSRAALREARRDQGRQYQEWLQANPDIAAEVQEWREWASDMQADRWDQLDAQYGEPGQAAA